MPLIEARRYRIACRAFLANSGTIPQLRAATNASRPDLARLLTGGFAFVTSGKAKQIEGLLPKREREWVAGAPSYDVTVGMVPTEIVAPLIHESFERFGREATAMMVGVQPRQLFGIVEERSGVRFSMADRLVCQLSSPSWWEETHERRKWYWSHNAVFGRTPEERRVAHRRADARHRAKMLVS